MKRLLLSLIFLFITVMLQAQPNTGCAKISGSGLTDSWDMVKTFDGNFVLAGSFLGFGGYRQNYLLKVNASGDTIWSRLLGVTGNIALYSVAEATEHAIIAVGVGIAAASVVKLDAGGTLLWSKKIVVNGQDEGAGIVATPDGGCFISIVTQQTVTPFYQQLYGIKLDAVGNKVWERTIRNQDNIYAGAMVGISAGMTIENHYLLGGWSPSSGVLTNPFFVVCLDENGVVLWAKQANVAGVTYAFIATPDSGFVMAGYGCQLPGSDGYLAKFDKDGNKDWDLAYGTDSTLDIFYDAVATSDGGIIAAGNSQITSTINTRGFVLKADSSGNALWAKSIGNETEFVDLRGVAEVTDGYVAGGRLGNDMYIASLDADGNVCVNCHGADCGAPVIGTDFTSFSWIDERLTASVSDITYNVNSVGTSSLICSGIGIDEPDVSSSVILFPNPADDKFTVAVFPFGTWGLDIYGMRGEKIYSTTFAGNKHVINVAALTPGIYTVKMQHDSGIAMKKLILK